MMEGETPLLSNIQAEEDEESVSIQGCILDPNSTSDKKNDPVDSDSEIYSAHSQPLTEEVDVLRPNEQIEDVSTPPMTSSNVSDNLNRAVTLSLRDQANFTDAITGSQATLGALTYP
jgi:hypothetical protein